MIKFRYLQTVFANTYFVECHLEHNNIKFISMQIGCDNISEKNVAYVLRCGLKSFKIEYMK